MSEQYKSRQEIEGIAQKLLTDADALRVPVPVDVVAHRLGLALFEAALGDGVSGVLVMDSGKGTIGYSEDQAEVRQRFTIAHEIGHFCLHAGAEKLFIDKTYVYKRDNESSSGENRREIQANLFAAALLMPQSLILDEITEIDFDVEDESSLSLLATRFDVSMQAMSFRLASLGVFSDLESI